MQLLESVRFENNEFSNLAYHQERMNRSRFELLNLSDEIDLVSRLKEHSLSLKSGLYKCRVIYDSMIRKVEFVPYQKPKIESLKLIVCDSIDYGYKFTDRAIINNLFSQKEAADDIIILKDGFVTDSSTANLLFYDGSNWYTPSKPLLPGTQRANLLDRSKIILTDIVPSDFIKFEKVRLVNAMLRFEDEVDVGVSFLDY